MTGGLPSGPNLESWTYWWSFNKERFLKLNERIAAVEASGTVATDPESNNKNSRSNMRPSRQQLESEVVPVLLDILQKESDPLIVASAMLSAAEIAEKPDDVLESLKRLAGSGNANISENAALAMGILGTAPSIETLKTIFEDSEAGRQLCGRKNEVPWRVRTNAAYGLGLAAANTNNPHHQKTAREILLKSLAGISGGRKSHDDIGVAVILALSMFTDADSSAAAALEKFFNENREKLDLITSHVPPAIGKLLMRASSADRERYARSLVALSRADSNPPSRLARCGMGIALGLITNSADAFAADIVKELRVSVEERISKFPEAAYLSVISLGEIAGSGAPGGEIEKFLAARASADGGRVTTRTWAAIALGVEGFLQIERGMFTSKDDISTSLELKMLEVKDPEQKSAFAIALGLRHCAAADKSLLKCLQSVRVDEQRGYFALALGMIGATAQSPAIQQIVKDSGRRPGFLQQAVIGLAVMGDKGAVPLLIQMMRDEHLQSSAVQAAAADALGFVGDYRAVGPLLEFAKNDRNDRTTLTRTFAIVALGLVGDRASQRWYARISEQLNYIAFVETLTDLVWEQ
ncbi:MAG: HEAT repeat domain-containing protein [Planctomycetes bacterium]|nr:HEAT repeat domain-containing protein [Planctomycetota bacterium]